MPYHARVVSKSRKLMWWQLAVSVCWAWLIFHEYFTEIPEGENGSVIVGMFVFIPFICLLSQVVFFVVHYTGCGLFNWCKTAYNKALKSDS